MISGRKDMKRLEEITDYYGPQIAKAAFELGAIKLNTKNPFRWASGYRMPIYNDNRQFLGKASYRALICDAFTEMVYALNLEGVDNIAGTATAGIPHATSLADRLNKPLSYVRSSSKDHGMGHQIEGLGANSSYDGKKVLLIEDLISTGSSSIKAVDAIRQANGVCTNCFAIFTYGLEKAKEAFSSIGCNSYTILSYPVMIKTAEEIGYITKEQSESLREWRKAPFEWGDEHGFPKEI